MLFYPESFKVSTPSDREVEITRDFNAPRELLFDAFTKPELVKRWLLGPDGWTMPVCEIDLRVDGRYRYLWRKEKTGHEMGMGGVFREIVKPSKLVTTEKFDDAWYPGDALNTTVFDQTGDITTVRLTVQYETREARDTATRSGMETGMAAGYSRLEGLLSSVPAEDGPRGLIGMPTVTETPPQLAATIHVTIPRSEIRTVMGPGLTELMTAVKSQGVGPAGPWFTHHLKMDPATFDFEICVPVSAPVNRVGRVVGREIPSQKVVQTVYAGPYEELGNAWAQFNDWIEANGHRTALDFYESYPVGPESSPNSADWRTELRRPLAST
jgi:uncharacterized protein YndB with AHSA1/START domain/effector-binding domain-containing protein